MSDLVTPSRAALAEAMSLSDEILKNLELGELPFTSIVLKASRLARILNDFKAQRMMQYEVGGYPSNHDGVPPDVFELAVLAGRESEEKDSKTNEVRKLVYMESIGQMEAQLQMTDQALLAAAGPNDSAGSVLVIRESQQERTGIRNRHATAAERLARSRATVYRYVFEKHYELKFSGIADDVFSRVRLRVDSKIGITIPESVKRLTAIYENLSSENSENWSNAVHGCRRVLQDLADAVFPPPDEVQTKTRNGEGRTIKLGKENYINRLIAFIDGRSESTTFTQIVGSQLGFLGDRLDAIFRAAQKGSHADIVRREEAERCVVYTYLLVGDILSLVE